MPHIVAAATSQNGTTSTPSDEAGSAALLRWIVVAHGVLAIVFGALLIFVPGRTLTFVAVLIGAYLIVVGIAYVALALLSHGLAGRERLAGVVVGALAGVAGAVVIARPEGSIKTVAVAAGIYLIVMGVTTAVFGLGVTRGWAILRGLLALAAGIALVAWPDVTVGVVAIVAGIFMLLRGTAEVAAGLSIGRA